MDNSAKPYWGRRPTGELLKRWPKDENGQPEEPVFLMRSLCLDIADEMVVNLLEAYGIPCIRQYPNDGDFGRLIMGTSGTGVEIFVPRSMYEDAVNLSEGRAVYVDEEL